MTPTSSDPDVIVSYLTLRKVVGALGMIMPIGVMVWGWALCGCLEIRRACIKKNVVLQFSNDAFLRATGFGNLSELLGLSI